MTHANRIAYALDMARAAQGWMASDNARELANNLACSEPESLDRATAQEAIEHRMREFGVACESPDMCAREIEIVARRHCARCA